MSSASSSVATTSSGSGESTKHMTKAHSTTTSPTSESGCTASNSSNSVGQKLLTLLKISRNQGSGESHSESISGGDYENKSAPASGYHHHNHHHHSSNTAAAAANSMSASIGMQQRVMSQSLSQTKLMMLSQDDGGVYKGPTDD